MMEKENILSTFLAELENKKSIYYDVLADECVIYLGKGDPFTDENGSNWINYPGYLLAKEINLPYFTSASWIVQFAALGYDVVIYNTRKIWEDSHIAGMNETSQELAKENGKTAGKISFHKNKQHLDEEAETNKLFLAELEKQKKILFDGAYAYIYIGEKENPHEDTRSNWLGVDASLIIGELHLPNSTSADFIIYMAAAGYDVELYKTSHSDHLERYQSIVDQIVAKNNKIAGKISAVESEIRPKS